MQFSCNSMKKGFNSVQSNKPDILIGQWSKKLTDSKSNASLGYRNIWIRWNFASETMAGVLSGFSFATITTIQQLKNSSNNENTVKSTACLVVVFREGNCQGNENYEPIQLNTLLERFYAEIKNKLGKSRKRRFHSIESYSRTDWTILTTELFSRTLNFFAP